MIGISKFLGLVRMLILRWTRRDMTDDVSGALSRREAHGDSTDASRDALACACALPPGTKTDNESRNNHLSRRRQSHVASHGLPINCRFVRVGSS